MSSRQEKIAQIESGLEKLKKKKSLKDNSILSFLLDVCTLLFIFLVVFNFLLGLAIVDQNSMQPNIMPNDIVMYNRMDHSYHRGDIIVADKVGHDVMVIKRIIGVPNDTIEINQAGEILVNGEVLHEDYLHLGNNVIHDVTFPITLKDNEYFVLGDNREVSLDSRSASLGNILKSEIKGKLIYIIRAFG